MKRMKLAALAVLTLFVAAVFAQTYTGGMLELSQTWSGTNTFTGPTIFSNTVTYGTGSGGAISGFSSYNFLAVHVSALPTCNSGLKDTLQAVDDASSPTYNATVTGGSSTHIPVYCNGTAWTAH